MLAELSSYRDEGQIPIVVATPPLETGGTEQHLLHILPALEARGFAIHVVALARGGALEPLLRQKITSLEAPEALPRPLGAMQQAWLLRQAARRTKARLIHAFLSEPSFAAVMAKMLMGASGRVPPHYVHGRRSLAFYRANRPLVQKLEIWSHRHATAIVGNSTAVSQELIAECQEAPRVCTIFNGIPLVEATRPEERRECRRMFGLPENALVITYVANFHSYKGHADLIRAFGLMIAERSHRRDVASVRLLLAGRDGGEENALRVLTAELGLRDQVVFAGEWPGSRQPYAAADIGALPSHTEGFSNSLIEGMMAGLPMVATSVGGNVDALDQDLTGLLVPAKDPPALAAALSRLADNPDMRTALGIAARLKAERHFSLGACVSRYDRLWRGILEATSGNPESWIHDPV
jgi:glycosyltransferase involved in cell wall biosynthesis